MTAAGHFIVLEGGEGAGKTTMAAALAAWVRTEITPQVLCVREPGSTPLCERIRGLLTDPGGEPPCPACELLLMYAARCQLLESVIRPHLEQGYVVIGDRHELSTAAYQGGGRQLPAAQLQQLRAAALGTFRPQLTLLLDLEPRLGLERARRRGGGEDRFEAEQLAFFERVRAAYLQAAACDPGICVVDASAAEERVRAAVIAAAREYFARAASAGAG